MPLKFLASLAALLLACAPPVVAQTTLSPTDPRPNSDMNAPRPNVNAGADREAFESRMQQSLKDWQGRVDQFAEQANASGDVNRKAQAMQLQRSWSGAQQQWKNLKQTQGANWASARDDFTRDMDRLTKQWNDAQTNPKAKVLTNTP